MTMPGSNRGVFEREPLPGRSIAAHRKGQQVGAPESLLQGRFQKTGKVHPVRDPMTLQGGIAGNRDADIG